MAPGLVLLVALLLAAAPVPQDASAELARAAALHQAGDLEGAIAAYRESLRLRPSAEAGSNLGAALAALGRYQEAIGAYRAALAVAPGDGRIRYNLALAHYKSADLPRAAEELEALHAQEPADARATLLLADCRLQLGEPAAVEALLRPLAAAQPDDRAVTYMLGMALVRNGKVQEGQRFVETLVWDGDSAEAQYLLGSAAFMAGDYPQAVERFSSALQKNPKLPSLRSYYGRALLFTGDADGAERAFRETLAESPNDYEANYFLGSVLSTRGRPKDARPFVEKAASLRPQSVEARDLLASLDSPGRTAAPEGPVSPLVGHPAPDVALHSADGREFRLSSLRGRPLGAGRARGPLPAGAEDPLRGRARRARRDGGGRVLRLPEPRVRDRRTRDGHLLERPRRGELSAGGARVRDRSGDALKRRGGPASGPRAAGWTVMIRS